MMTIEDVRDYCLSRPFATEDMPFGDGYVTFRVAGKIFCCLVLERGPLVQLKWNPEEFDEVIDTYSCVHQAWHWHKRHMIQLNFGEHAVDANMLKPLIDRAYGYVVSRLSRKDRIGLGLM